MTPTRHPLQIIVVENQHPRAGEGWWLCNLSGDRGLVPAAYCKLIGDDSSGGRSTGTTRAQEAPVAFSATNATNEQRSAPNTAAAPTIAAPSAGFSLAAPPTASRNRANSLRRPKRQRPR